MPSCKKKKRNKQGKKAVAAAAVQQNSNNTPRSVIAVPENGDQDEYNPLIHFWTRPLLILRILSFHPEKSVFYAVFCFRSRRIVHTNSIVVGNLCTEHAWRIHIMEGPTNELISTGKTIYLMHKGAHSAGSFYQTE